MDKLEEQHYFATPVYIVKKPEFLDALNMVSARYEEASREHKGTGEYINLMTGSYAHEPELEEFTRYVSQTAWNILSSQGFNMDTLATYFTEMWTQEHKHLSSMETHVHGGGSQISAFYFLSVPKGGCKMVIHDPRPGKVIINLPETDNAKITMGSSQVVFSAEPGVLILTNSWLPHSLTKNMSNDPVRFVHMNLSVGLVPEQESMVEVV